MIDPWIEKALRMQRETQGHPTLTILKAALWLEKNTAKRRTMILPQLCRFTIWCSRLERKKRDEPYCASITCPKH